MAAVQPNLNAFVLILGYTPDIGIPNIGTPGKAGKREGIALEGRNEAAVR